MNVTFPGLPFMLLYGIAGALIVSGVHRNSILEYFCGTLLLFVTVALTGFVWCCVRDLNKRGA